MSLEPVKRELFRKKKNKTKLKWDKRKELY